MFLILTALETYLGRVTPLSDGAHVAFGEVIDGHDVLDIIEATGVPGRETGRPSMLVTVSNSGLLWNSRYISFSLLTILRFQTE